MGLLACAGSADTNPALPSQSQIRLERLGIGQVLGSVVLLTHVAMEGTNTPTPWKMAPSSDRPQKMWIPLQLLGGHSSLCKHRQYLLYLLYSALFHTHPTTDQTFPRSHHFTPARVPLPSLVLQPLCLRKSRTLILRTSACLSVSHPSLEQTYTNFFASSLTATKRITFFRKHGQANRRRSAQISQTCQLLQCSPGRTDKIQLPLLYPDRPSPGLCIDKAVANLHGRHRRSSVL